MTRRESHQRYVFNVPGTDNHPPTVRVLFYHIYNLSDLINALALIVMVHVLILGTRVSPLETIDRSKVSLFSVSKIIFVKKLSASVSIPYMNTFIGKFIRIGASFQKPQNLFYNSSPENPLGCKQWEGVLKIKFHHVTECRDSSCPCSISLFISFYLSICSNRLPSFMMESIRSR